MTFYSSFLIQEYQRTEEFGQFLVEVQGQNDLVRALDGLGEPNVERWFSKLPPVILFQLKRYTFNTELKTAQKLNHRMEFPEKIFMDRNGYDLYIHFFKSKLKLCTDSRL